MLSEGTGDIVVAVIRLLSFLFLKNKEVDGLIDARWIGHTFGWRGISWLHLVPERTQFVHLFAGITELSPTGNQSAIGGRMRGGIHFTAQ